MSVELIVEDACVELGGTQILDRISFGVQPGEFVTLLGPSGSGKTTTLNLIAGFVRARSGHVRFGGEIVDDLAPQQRGIGIVFQNYAIFPTMSVLENVAFPLRARGVPRRERERRAQEYLELVQLGGMGSRRSLTLSGGQQQRVALARALVFEPALLLLDEPLAALDKQLRESMQIELKRIQREVGVTTIAVTHDQVEALTMSDRVGIMGAGRLEQYGTPEEVYRRPATEFVARFLGEANLLAVGADGHVPALGVSLPGARGGTAVVRPEDVDLLGANGSSEGVGTVAELDFQGARYRVVVEVQSGGSLIVSLPAGASGQALSRGDRVQVRCDPREIHVMERRS
jgi:putative spermidine/putrescine transport system ATP-binding protein